nr:putative integron gene cassette protein [uncultured bacterium]
MLGGLRECRRTCNSSSLFRNRSRAGCAHPADLSRGVADEMFCGIESAPTNVPPVTKSRVCDLVTVQCALKTQRRDACTTEMQD